MIKPKSKIVIYEPKLFYRSLIVDILEREECEIFVSENLKSLVASIYEFSPDLILINLVGLEDKDVEFLMALKKSFPTLPVIALVDADKKELVVKYVRTGVFDCVAKPILKEELILAVKKAEEFTYYKKEEVARLNRLKKLAHGSEKIYHFMKSRRDIKMPLNYPGDKLVQSILDSISIVLDAEKVSISWLDTKKKTYQVIACAGHCVDIKMFKPRAVGEGIIGYVANNRETIYVKDIGKDKRFNVSSFKDQYKSGSFLCGPIIIADEVAAVLSVSDRKDGKPFSEEDFFVFKTFLVQITYAIETGLMIGTLEANNSKLKIYKDIAEHIVNLVEAGDILKNILQTVSQYFNAKAACLYIMDENREYLINEGWYGMDFKEKVSFLDSHNQLLTKIHNSKDKEIAKLLTILTNHTGLGNFFTIPIKLKDFPLGFLLVVNMKEDVVDEVMLDDISKLVSVAFKNNWLYKNLCIIADELVKTNKDLEELNKNKLLREVKCV